MKPICDIDKDCISEDDKCLNLETKKLKDTKQDIDNIIYCKTSGTPFRIKRLDWSLLAGVISGMIAGVIGIQCQYSLQQLKTTSWIVAMLPVMLFR